MLVQRVQDPLLAAKRLALYVYRTDLLPPHFLGNKWFKLKYNLAHAKQLGKKSVLSFGGAYSNHLRALAYLGPKYGFDTIGVVRGEAHTSLNPVLSFAQKAGMHLTYVDRSSYREKDTSTFVQSLRAQWGDFYLIPEGGSNARAVQGCKEILSDVPLSWDYVCTPCGTGGTLAGLVASVPMHKKVLGFAVLKGAAFLERATLDLLKAYEKTFRTTLLHKNFVLCRDYHFGGYAKKNDALVSFVAHFAQQHHLPIEWVYTGKMFYGIYDLIRKDYFSPHTTILALHTGGLPAFSPPTSSLP